MIQQSTCIIQNVLILLIVTGTDIKLKYKNQANAKFYILSVFSSWLFIHKIKKKKQNKINEHIKRFRLNSYYVHRGGGGSIF